MKPNATNMRTRETKMKLVLWHSHDKFRGTLMNSAYHFVKILVTQKSRHRILETQLTSIAYKLCPQSTCSSMVDLLQMRLYVTNFFQVIFQINNCFKQKEVKYHHVILRVQREKKRKKESIRIFTNMLTKLNTIMKILVTQTC